MGKGKLCLQRLQFPRDRGLRTLLIDMGKRGERLRPCLKCGVEIRFVPWEERRATEKKNIWHWVEESGEHHKCRRTALEVGAEAQMHIDSILEG